MYVLPRPGVPLVLDRLRKLGQQKFSAVVLIFVSRPYALVSLNFACSRTTRHSIAFENIRFNVLKALFV